MTNTTAPKPSDVFPSKKIVSEEEPLEILDPAPDADSLSERQAFERKNKPVFVRKPHLTDKALAKHPGLMALKDSLETNKSQTPKPRPRRRQPAATSK